MTTSNSDPVHPWDSIGLFAGVGGFEHAMSTFDIHPILLCEIDNSARTVLNSFKPGMFIHPDVRDLDDIPYASVMLAGFPCQDLSPAGHKAGIEGPKSSLVRHVFRLLERQRIPTLVLENVPFIIDLADGTGMRSVTGYLDHLGYRWAYRVVNTQWFGLPQRRQRVFIVGSLTHDPREILLADDVGTPTLPRASDIDLDQHAVGFYWSEGKSGIGFALDAIPPLKAGSGLGIPTPPAILLPDGTLGTPTIEDAEALQGMPVNWTHPAEATAPRDRWRLIGNAVSFPISAWLGERLRNPGRYDPTRDLPVTGAKLPRAAWNMGNGIFASTVSENPLGVPQPAIANYLTRPLRPLSARATAGFLQRCHAGNLRFPARFLERVQRHLDRVDAPLLSFAA